MVEVRLTRDGTNGRVYGGDPGLVHIRDGERAGVGMNIAFAIDAAMRSNAGERSSVKPLCPGCYMIVGFNALVELARMNGQPVSELANTMVEAFKRLAANPAGGLTEEVQVILDIDLGAGAR